MLRIPQKSTMWVLEPSHLKLFLRNLGFHHCCGFPYLLGTVVLRFFFQTLSLGQKHEHVSGVDNAFLLP